MSEPSQPANFDAYAPAEIALRVEEGGIKKAHVGLANTLVLAFLAGAFIALGANFFTAVTTGSNLGLGPTRMLGGVAFSLGLFLVVGAGAELFTGNNLLTMAWASRKISTYELLRNWTLVFLGNFVGAIATTFVVHLSGQWTMSNNAIGTTMVEIAVAKVSLPFLAAFVRGVLCNALVCLAVWLCFGARSVTDKVLAIVFPISAFVAAGFEHCVANMYLVPLGILLRDKIPNANAHLLQWDTFFLHNLLPVTLGNVVGGAGLVGVVYWFVYLRRRR